MADYAKIQRRLEERLHKLTARVDEIDDSLREPVSKDFEEQATEQEGDEVLESLGNAAVLEIQQIQAALERIENGTYGLCIGCGDPIPMARLVAFPTAVRCVDCSDG